MTKRGGRSGGSGRRTMALALLAFLVLASAIVWRKSVGFAEGQRLRQLAERRTELDAKRTRLDGEIRSNLTLRKLGAVVEKRLGLKVPADSQIILLTRPRADSLP
ncbi:MAG TPA: hypothetical protein VGQ52_13140 [Gemmatimonadaceae bacterium]|nr:hypothetical protein [Gemmatimonadaceae bacterium]